MKNLLPFLFIILISSCVSKKKYLALQDEKTALNKEVINLNRKVDGLSKQNIEFSDKLKKLSNKQ